MGQRRRRVQSRRQVHEHWYVLSRPSVTLTKRFDCKNAKRDGMQCRLLSAHLSRLPPSVPLTKQSTLLRMSYAGPGPFVLDACVLPSQKCNGRNGRMNVSHLDV